MFASNFPVDSMYGTFDELYATFSAVTAGLDSESREKLFASERRARLSLLGGPSGRSRIGIGVVGAGPLVWDHPAGDGASDLLWPDMAASVSRGDPCVKKLLLGAAVAVVGLVLAGCSSPSNSGQSTSSTAATTSTTIQGTGGPGNPTTGSSQAVNLPVTNQIRSQLVTAGAALNNIPVSEYSGLAPGLTYYALDKASNTYWAAARLVPAPSPDPSNPTQAQVASQDAGSYYVFSQPKGGGWTAVAAGNTGPATPCPVTVPAPVVAVWGWPAGRCRPAGA